MKIATLFLPILCIFFLLWACNQDKASPLGEEALLGTDDLRFFFDSIPCEPKNELIHATSIQGDWHMRSYRSNPFDSDGSIEFTRCEVVLQFDTLKQEVKVFMKEEYTQGYFAFWEYKPGKFSYSFGPHSCSVDNQGLIIGEHTLGSLRRDKIENDSILLTNVCFDGSEAVFVR